MSLKNIVNIPGGNRAPGWLRFGFAAALGLLIGVSFFAYSLYKNMNKLKYDLAATYAENEVLSDELGTLRFEMSNLYNQLALVMKPGSKLITLKGDDEKAPDALVSLVLNKDAKELFIVSSNLPVPPMGQQYQVWALNKGKFSSAGVFEVSPEGFEMQKLSSVEEVDSFMITLESAGGSKEPSVDAIYLRGKI
jgi:hypothetical protein